MVGKLAVISVLFPWWTCNPLAPNHDDRVAIAPVNSTDIPVAPGFTDTHREEIAPPEDRTPTIPARPPPLIVPDEAVVHALGRAQPAFLRCYRRAQRDDPSLGSTKVNLRLYVEPAGTVIAAYADVSDAKFRSCLEHVAEHLQFPAPGAMAMAYVAFAL